MSVGGEHSLREYTATYVPAKLWEPGEGKNLIVKGNPGRRAEWVRGVPSAITVIFDITAIYGGYRVGAHGWVYTGENIKAIGRAILIFILQALDHQFQVCLFNFHDSVVQDGAYFAPHPISSAFKLLPFITAGGRYAL